MIKQDLSNVKMLRSFDVLITELPDFLKEEKKYTIAGSESYSVGKIELLPEGSNLPQDLVGKIIFYEAAIEKKFPLKGAGDFSIINQEYVIMLYTEN